MNDDLRPHGTYGIPGIPKPLGSGYVPEPGPQEPARRGYSNVIIGVALFAAICVGVGVMVIAVFTTRSGGAHSSGRPSVSQPSSAAPKVAAPTARSLVAKLAGAKMVRAKTCKAETPNAPAVSQQRCTVGGGNEVVVIAFSDASGVEGRVKDFAAEPVKVTLLKGPTWIVNFAELGAKQRSAMAALLGGAPVTVGG